MWEILPEAANGCYEAANTLHCASHRLKVPGGWVVRTITFGYNIGASSTQTFVADRDHEWKIEASPQEAAAA